MFLNNSSRSALFLLKRSSCIQSTKCGTPASFNNTYSRSSFVSLSTKTPSADRDSPKRATFDTLVNKTDNSNYGATTTEQLSNRQKFKQIDPPLRLYEKLERLGFGTLRRTKRYQFVRQQKTKDKHLVPDPEYKLPLLSFFAGAKTPASFPSENLEEIGFVGRSNVGKSSLLNSLASTTIVRTSDKPGLTQQLNFYSVGRLFSMVDMPGYGFAFVDDDQRKQWRHLMETYINERKTLKRVYVVIDARHGLKLADMDFLKMLDMKRVKFQVVMTKCDLQVLPTLARRIMVVQDNIHGFRNALKDVLVVSSKTGAGVNQMRKEMLFLVGHLKEKDFYQDKNKK